MNNEFPPANRFLPNDIITAVIRAAQRDTRSFQHQLEFIIRQWLAENGHVQRGEPTRALADGRMRVTGGSGGGGT